MAEKSTVSKEVIKHKGFWNFSDFYSFCFDFLKDKEYTVKEKSYTEKLSGAGKEILIEWDAEKKVTDYFKNHVSVKWHVTQLKDAEIERDGKKESTNKGDLKITIEAALEKDYEDRWENKPIWKILRGIYEKYIIRTTIDEYEDHARGPALEMVSEIKSFLQLSGR